MMGSNSNTHSNIALATEQLAHLGELIELNQHTSADHTGKTDTWYLNKAVIINLTNTLIANDIYITLKNIEKQCGRIRNSSIVALDLDIMAVYIDRWYIIKERLPFKNHEKICIGLYDGSKLTLL